MIIITGATGKFGHATVERLIERIPASQVGVSVRNPEKIRSLSERGVRVRQGERTPTACTVPSRAPRRSSSCPATELIGRKITRVRVADKEYRAGLISHGISESRADMLLGLFAASREGEFAAVDPTLERLLGRPPMSMRDVLRSAALGVDQSAA
jgi:hypothetical protein